MNAEGLPEKWRRRFQKDGNRCEKDRKEKKKRDQRITLFNMSGSFVVLLVGIVVSVVVYIIEFILLRRQSAIVEVQITVAKTDDSESKIKSASAIKQPSPTDSKMNNTNDAEVNNAAPDNDSTVIVISPAPITDLKIASIEIREEPKLKAMIEETDEKTVKVNIASAVANEEEVTTIINAIQPPIIARKINERE